MRCDTGSGLMWGPERGHSIQEQNFPSPRNHRLRWNRYVSLLQWRVGAASRSCSPEPAQAQYLFSPTIYQRTEPQLSRSRPKDRNAVGIMILQA